MVSELKYRSEETAVCSHYKCRKCEGRGYVHEILGVQVPAQRCPDCGRPGITPGRLTVESGKHLLQPFPKDWKEVCADARKDLPSDWTPLFANGKLCYMYI